MKYERLEVMMKKLEVLDTGPDTLYKVEIYSDKSIALVKVGMHLGVDDVILEEDYLDV